MESFPEIMIERESPEMFQKPRINSLSYFKLLQSTRTPHDSRPISVATVFVDSDEEILSDEEEEEEAEEEEEDEYASNSARCSLRSAGGPSINTIDSYDEVTTPHSSTQALFADLSAAAKKPVEGPRGPHLFHSPSSSSPSSKHSSLDEDLILSLSPLTPYPNNQAARQAVRAPAPVPSPSPLAPPPLNLTPAPPPQTAFRFTNEPLDETRLSWWEPDLVAQWMLEAGLDAPTAGRFLENDISGAILIPLKFEDLKELGIQSFGIRTKVWQQVTQLKERFCAGQPRPDVGTPSPAEDMPARELRGHHHQAPQPAPQPPATQPMVVAAEVGVGMRRTQRRAAADHDIISPLESVSIVGIEAAIPQPHHCSKGEDCAKHRRQARRIEAFLSEYPNADLSTGKILIGNPGNPKTARAIDLGDPTRPTSDVVPSVVASSDVLGPGSAGMPPLKLHEATLRNVMYRDPQDNVRQFLHFQHQVKGQSPPMEPPTPPFEASHDYDNSSEAENVSRFSSYSSIAAPVGSARSSVVSAAATTASTVKPFNFQGSPLLDSSVVAPPRESSRPTRQTLPKLSIPAPPPATASRVASSQARVSSPLTAVRARQSSPVATQSPDDDTCSPARDQNNSSPPNAFNPAFNPYRFGTPFSEMDVPVTAVPLGPVARDASQSVPPDMIYRTGAVSAEQQQQQKQQQQPAPPQRSMSRASVRRPSFGVLPPLDENKVSSVTRTSPRGLRPPPRFQYPWSPVEPRYEQCMPPACLTPTETTASKTSGSSSPRDSSSSTSTITSTSTSASTSAASTNTSLTAASDVMEPKRRGASSVAPTADYLHAGHMKKRKTKFLRHEWQDGFFTLRGTRLAMHPPEANVDDVRKTLEYIDVDDYAIACSGVASSSKLRAAFRAVQIANGRNKDDAGAFSFQLIPNPEKVAGGDKPVAGRLRRRGSTSGHAPSSSSLLSEGADGTGKTHHFAVKNRDERIDWMRELMLAKALKKKGDGFEISRNGNMI